MKLFPLLLLAVLAGPVWAHEVTLDDMYPVATEEDIRDRGYKPGARPGMPLEYAKDLDIRYGDGSPLESETDRFLKEKVEPHVKSGDELLAAKTNRTSREADLELDQAAIAHYLRALVEIEKEKLRRMK